LDYNNKRNLRIVQPDSFFVYWETKFSPDKSKLITNGTGYSDMIYTTAPGWPFLIYDIEDNTFQRVNGIDNESGEYKYPHLQNSIWFNDGTGFYFEYVGWLLGSTTYNYYDIFNMTFSKVDFASDRIIFLIGLMENNSLLSLYEEESEQLKLTVYEPGTDSQIFLQNNVISEKLKKRHWHNIEWSQESELIVFSEFYPDNSHSKISVTNLDGTYYKTYTSGEYKDNRPIWSPDGSTILFQRAIDNNSYKFMKIDLETGTVSDFLEAGEIDAVEIYDLDY